MKIRFCIDKIKIYKMVLCLGRMERNVRTITMEAKRESSFHVFVSDELNSPCDFFGFAKNAHGHKNLLSFLVIRIRET